jgi:isoleucyl-tRNA synthetase
LVNVSRLKIETLKGEPSEKDETGRVNVIVAHADGQKCERCWHWEMDIGPEFHPEHPTICGRCVEAVKQFGVI